MRVCVSLRVEDKEEKLLDTNPCRLSVIIPTINEEDGIVSTLSELPLRTLEAMGFACEVTVVDGGSSDRTKEKAEQLGARVIVEPCRGYGRAYKTGFRASKGDILVALDGDHTYPASTVPMLVRTMIEKDLDFVTASRLEFMETGAMSWMHRLGNWILSTTVRLLFGVRLRDSQSGMWVIRRDALDRILPESDGMAFSEEIKIRAFKCCKCTEIPVRYRRRVGDSKIRTVLDGFRNLFYLSRLRFTVNLNRYNEVSVGKIVSDTSEFSKEKLPKVSIIIPVKNEERTIANTINSVLRIDYPDYDIVLVDGGSEDQTISIVEQIKGNLQLLQNKLRIIKTNDSAPGQGRNVGIRNSSGEIVAFVDGDCCVAKDWLKNAVVLLEQEGVGGVGGPVISCRKGAYLSKTLLDIVSTFLASADSTLFARHSSLVEVKNIPSCNAVYRREAIAKAGLYSKDLRFCEDVDLNYRIRESGYRLLYSSDVVVEHDWKARTFGSLFRFMFGYGAGRAVASRKYHYLFSLFYAVPSIALFGLFSLLLLSFICGGIFPYVLGFLSCSYGILVLISACLVAHRFRDRKMAVLAPVAYVITHVGYAIGFIWGLIKGDI
jgi:glycosyltransferase involved in cell wall biosynthesis